MRKVLKSFVDDEANDKSAVPKTPAERKDQWLIRWSQLHGVDMTDYMVNRWGLEVSDGAKQAVAAMKLPTWLPAVGGLEGEAANGPTRLDLKGAALSYDGVAAVSNVTAGRGRVKDNGDGSWTYTPARGFTGIDEVTYDVTSSTGHAHRSTTYVKVGG